jgi:hypothetical protein
MKEVLYESQRKSLNTIDDSSLKTTLNDLILDAIIKDSRPFNDFRKEGLKSVLNFLAPEYNPQSRQTISKKIKTK